VTMYIVHYSIHNDLMLKRRRHIIAYSQIDYKEVHKGIKKVDR